MTLWCVGVVAIFSVVPVAGRAQDEVDKESAAPKKLSKQALQFFESRIRPVLVEHCYSCHSLDANLAEGGLRLDSRDAVLRGGSGGPTLVPGDPNASLLIRAVEARDPALAMPPEESGGKLSEDQIKDLVRWVRMGAPDPREEAAHVQAKLPDAPLEHDWWAYQPLATPPIPAATGWAWNTIDRFVEAAQLEMGIAVMEDAAAEALVRRLYFDLTGLPPTLEEQNAFSMALASGLDRREVIEQTVDRLLASDQFGVHWGRHWLDVARYGESTGRDINLPYNQAWRYRDWVIEAFQDNLPFDAFLVQQIAGDLLPYDNDQQRAKQLIATGFLAIGSRSINEGNPKQFAVDQADEQIDSVFQAAMGTTLACARCHDHKFDPISQAEYTAVAGIFLSTDTRFGVKGGNNARNSAPAIELPEGSQVPKLPVPWKEEQLEKKRSELTQLRDAIEAINQQQREARKGSKEIDRSRQQELRKLTNQANELEFQLSALDAEGHAKALAMGVLDKALPKTDTPNRKAPPERGNANRGRGAFVSIDDSPFFARGDIGLPGEKVSRSVPNLFGNADRYPIPKNSSGRLQLAEWIVSPDNPLTARVAVNRVWQWMIGQGIVDSVDNFGTTGSKPTHPELLDHLAREFIASGWNVKQLIRSIATSRTYQISSIVSEDSPTFETNFAKDPENRFCWRGKRRRLQAEEIRDAMLCMSGRLDRSRPAGTTMAKHFGNKIDVSIGRRREKGEVISDDIVRSVFLSMPRTALPEMLELFDLPDGTFVQGVRETTNVPSQSLYLLNSPAVAGYAGGIVRGMMERIPGRGSDRFEPRVGYLYALILGRAPKAEELRLADRLFRESDGSEAGWVSIVRGLLATAEFRYLD